MIDFLKKLIGPSIMTTIAGVGALIVTYSTAGVNIVEQIMNFADSDPLTVFDWGIIKESLAVFGLGNITGFGFLKAKDNAVSTEEVKAFEESKAKK